MPAEPRLLIFVATYNEARNIGDLYRQLRQVGPDWEILFIDDSSPDGTGEIIDRLCESDPAVHAVHRSSKQGIGSAHQAGIRWAYDHGFDLLLTMDCDFTHPPACIPEFLPHAAAYQVVIGSRFLKRRSLSGWNLLRRTLTFGGHFATRCFLGMPFDATGAFRLYRLDRVPRGIFDLVESRGYSFFFESLYLLWRNGAAVKEVPVRLPARTQGHSKMRIKDAVQSLRLLVSLFLRRLLRPASLRAAG